MPPTSTARRTSWRRAGVAGSNGYGTFSIDAGGAWTYTMTAPTTSSSPARPTPTPSRSPPPTARRKRHRQHPRHQRRGGDLRRSTASLTETQRAAEHQRHADHHRRRLLRDLRRADRHGRQPLRHLQHRRRGRLDLHRDSAHDEFVAGTTYTDTFTVAAADGTTHQRHGPHPRHQRRGGDLRQQHGEPDRDERGAEHQRHADDQRRRLPATFVAQTGVAGSLRHLQHRRRGRLDLHRQLARTTSSWPARPTPTPSRSLPPTARRHRHRPHHRHQRCGGDLRRSTRD